MTKTILQTQRLVLTEPTDQDLLAVDAWLTNPEIMRFQGGVQSDEKIIAFKKIIREHWKKHGFGHFFIFLNEQSKPIGLVSLKYLNDEDEIAF